MSEREQCPLDQPPPHSAPPSTNSANVVYIHRDIVPQEVMAYQSGTCRMPPSRCVVPQNFGKSEVSSCSLVSNRNDVKFVSPQNSLAVTYHSNIDTGGLNCVNTGNTAVTGSISLQNIQACPSTSSSGIKRKLVDYLPKDISNSSGDFKGSHDESYTTGYTSDDSDEYSRCCQKSRRRHKLGVKSFPQSFGNSNIGKCVGRPLFKEKIAPSMEKLHYDHLKREQSLNFSKGSEIGTTWEEKKLQLAERERQLVEAEEAMKKEEEKAQECLRQALQQQEIALNEREAALRAREVEVQRKLEHATKILEESKKMVNIKMFKSENLLNPSDYSYTNKGISNSFHENLSANVDESPLAPYVSNLKSQEPPSFENKGGFKGGYRYRSLSESTMTAFGENNSEQGANVSSLHHMPKNTPNISDKFSAATPKLETPVVSNPSCLSRSISLNAEVKNLQNLSNVSDSNEILPVLEPSKVIRTYTRTGRCRTISETSGSPPVIMKTDNTANTQAHYMSHVSKSPDNTVLSPATAACSEETILNGGASVTITPFKLAQASSNIPKLELRDCEDDSCHRLQSPSFVGRPTELKHREVCSLVVCDNQTKPSLIPDQVKVSPPKIVCVKPVPPIDKSVPQMIVNDEYKGNLLLEYQNVSAGRDYAVYGMKDFKRTHPIACISGSNVGKKKLSVANISVISIPGIEGNVSSQGDYTHKISNDVSHESLAKKNVDIAKVDMKNTDESKHLDCNMRDQRESQNVVDQLHCEVMFDSNRQKSGKPSSLSTQEHVSALQPLDERKSQPFVRAEEGHQWHNRPFLPGDIFYTPESKFDSRATPVAQRDDVQASSDIIHAPLSSKHAYPFQSSLSEFSQTPPTHPQALYFPKKPSSLDNDADDSANLPITYSTDQFCKTSIRNVVPGEANEKYTVTRPSFTGQSFSYIKGRKLTHISSCRGSPPIVNRSVSHATQPLQTSSASPVITKSNIIGQSPQVPYVVNHKILPFQSVTTSSETTSTNFDIPFSGSSSFINSHRLSISTDISSSSSQEGLAKGLQKPIVEPVSESSVLFSVSSRKDPHVLHPTITSCNLQLSGDGVQDVSHDMQFDKEHTGSKHVRGLSQVIKISQKLLESQKVGNGCVSQWESKILYPNVSETLTNLKGYDPVSQTTMSNPVLLQSILNNSINSSGFVRNSECEISAYSLGTGENKTNQQQADVLVHEAQKKELTFQGEVDDIQQELAEDQRAEDLRDVGSNVRSTEFCDESQADMSILGHPLSEKVELKSCDSDTTQTHSDMAVDNEKLNNEASDISRNFSDSESETSKTENFFISTGILRTQDLTKNSTSSLQDEYLNLDESNLNEDCFSDSDNGCEVKSNPEEIFDDSCENQTDLQDTSNNICENQSNPENIYPEMTRTSITDESNNLDCKFSKSISLDSELNHRGYSEMKELIDNNQSQESSNHYIREKSDLPSNNEEKIVQIDLKGSESKVVPVLCKEEKVSDVSVIESKMSISNLGSNVPNSERSPNSLVGFELTGSECKGSDETGLYNYLDKAHELGKNKTRKGTKRRGRGWSRKQIKCLGGNIPNLERNPNSLVGFELTGTESECKGSDDTGLTDYLDETPELGKNRIKGTKRSRGRYKRQNESLVGNVPNSERNPTSLVGFELTRAESECKGLDDTGLNSYLDETRELGKNKSKKGTRRGSGWSRRQNKSRRHVPKRKSLPVSSLKVLNEEMDGNESSPLQENKIEGFSERTLNGAKVSGSEMEANPCLVDKHTESSKVTLTKESDIEEDYHTFDYESESESFEHVSHSGRKLKLNGYLRKFVKKENLQKTKTHDPKEEKQRGTKKPANTKKVTKKAVVKTEFSAVNIKCGKCSHVSETKAKFVSHVQNEHNGLARPEGESQEFDEDAKAAMLHQTFKLRRKLKCELCSKIFRSLPGFRYHSKVCGYTVEELQIVCNLCGRMLSRCYQKSHMRKFHNLYERKRRRNSPVSENVGPRPKRQAATNCSAKLKVWDSNPNGVDEGSGTLDIDCDNELAKSYKREFVQPSLDIQSKWEEEISLNGKAGCVYLKCDYIFENVKDGCRHFSRCPLSDNKKYKCKICNISCESEDVIREHITNRHKELEESIEDMESDLSEEDVGYKRKQTQHTLSKFSNMGRSNDLLKVFEPCLSWAADFILENYSDNLFPNLTAAYNDWLLLGVEDASKFAPSVTVSPKFKVSVISKVLENSKSTEWQCLNRFNGTCVYESFALFAGGPVLASAWCPLPFKDSVNEKPQFLALSASSVPNTNFDVLKSFSCEGIIQIWSCFINGANAHVPEFQLGIAHEFGNVWSLAWCPSGIYDECDMSIVADKSNLKRMGLLAAGCSDGTVRIFVIPTPKAFMLQDTLRVFKVKPKLTLRINTLPEGDEQCLKVDWFRGRGHGYIAGAYSTGFVSIWDLYKSSPLLCVTKPEGIIFYPVRCFQAHNGVCTSVAFCPTTGGRNLLSGGNDRTYKFWDLENTNMPLNISRKGLVTDMTWLSHWAGGFVAFDDVFSLGNTHTCYKENGYFGIHSRNILSANSPVWTVSGSEWFNSIIQGDAAGEVMVTVQQQLLRNYEHDKVSYKRKFPLLGVYAEKLAETKRLSFRTNKQEVVQEKMKGKKPKKKNPSTQYEQNSGEEEDALGHGTHLNFPQTYAEMCDDYGVVFREQDYQSFSNIPEAELMERKRSEGMEPGPIACYPLMSVTSVSWNSNFEARSWVFIGTQSGLCRIVSIGALKNDRDDEVVKTIKNKAEKQKNRIKQGR